MYEQPNGNQQDAFYGGTQEGHIGDEMNGQYNYRSQVSCLLYTSPSPRDS